MVKALARMYSGDWVADCPRPGCTNTEFLSPNQWEFSCGAYARSKGQSLDAYCLWTGPIEWPGNAYEITKELMRRPVKGTRHWFPADYPAERLPAGMHHLRGQSVAHLADEFMRNGSPRAETVKARLASEEETRFAAQASEVRAARKEMRERWEAAGHGIGGPLFHPGSDKQGFPPEHTITRGPGQVAPPCHCGEPGCKPKGGK